MIYFPEKTKQRMDGFVKRLDQHRRTVIGELDCTVYVTEEPVPFESRMSGKEMQIRPGESWGKLWDCGWFHFTGAVPAGYEEKELQLLIDLSGEGLYYTEKAGAVTGLTTGSTVYEYGSQRKNVIPLSLCGTEDGSIDIWVDGACNDLFGRFVDSGSLKEAFIAVYNSEIDALYFDFIVLKKAMDHLREDSPRHYSILYALNGAMNVIYDFTREEAAKARIILKKELDKRGGDPSLKIKAIGHAHIDLAWLWPLRETPRKAARTFATVMRLMERYPDYKFGSSQPQMLQWIKEYYPQLFEQIRERAAEGRFELQGGMWVEADTNLSGGEALIRQILYGTRFFREEFGVEVENVWLPDVFGYSGALPQIMKKSGLPYFMTQKLSWNEHNAFPYHTFNWYGIDGTAVLAHMLPEENYNSPADPGSIRIVERNFHEKGISDQALVLFGIGDGGGGPGEEHLENLARIADMSEFSPVEQGFARDFFREIDKDTQRYPSWKGELYFENHRGTYTSQAKNKYYNRKMEYALRELEYAASLAIYYGYESYPREEVEQIWKEVLLYQFHDILPGSSISRVYEETTARYETLLSRVRELIDACYETLTEGDGFTVFNSLTAERVAYLKNEESIYAVRLPSAGQIALTEKVQPGISLKAGEDYLENENLRVGFGRNGEIISITDKRAEKEVLDQSQASNCLQVFQDLDSDAWNIQVYYDEQTPRCFELTERRAFLEDVCAVMEQRYVFGNSTLIQSIRLEQGSELLRFDTRVDWQESNKMLRTAFHTVIRADDAVCDIQFGSVKRPAHRNTTLDRAKFEICAHKYVDLSRDDYGVALINDCKYGYKVLGGSLELALLRSAMSPCVDQDKGIQEFSYALYPHAGNEKTACVEQRALEFNIPPVVVRGHLSDGMETSFLTSDSPGIELSALKPAEDGRGLIARFFETSGENVVSRIGIPKKCKNAELCNLMEQKEKVLEISVDQHDLALSFHPYEIITIRII